MPGKSARLASWLAGLPFALLALQILTVLIASGWLGQDHLLSSNRYAFASLAATVLVPVIGLCALPFAHGLPLWLRSCIAVLYLPVFAASWIASGF